MNRSFSCVFSVLALMLTGVIGCDGGSIVGGGSSDKPSESEGQQAVMQAIEKNGQGKIKLVSFKKTDGKMIDLTKEYIMNFDAEIEFLADATISRQGITVASYFSPDDKHSGKAGTKRTFPGLVRFSKSENGWSSKADKVWLKDE